MDALKTTLYVFALLVFIVFGIPVLFVLGLKWMAFLGGLI